MNQKENPGGELSNEQIENETKIGKNKDEEIHGYAGSQDTGDQKLRAGDDVIKRNDGLPPEDTISENKSTEHDFD